MEKPITEEQEALFIVVGAITVWVFTMVWRLAQNLAIAVVILIIWGWIQDTNPANELFNVWWTVTVVRWVAGEIAKN